MIVSQPHESIYSYGYNRPTITPFIYGDGAVFDLYQETLWRSFPSIARDIQAQPHRDKRFYKYDVSYRTAIGVIANITLCVVPMHFINSTNYGRAMECLTRDVKDILIVPVYGVDDRLQRAVYNNYIPPNKVGVLVYKTFAPVQEISSYKEKTYFIE